MSDTELTLQQLTLQDVCMGACECVCVCVFAVTAPRRRLMPFAGWGPTQGEGKQPAPLYLI